MTDSADSTLKILTKFHREVFLPDLERMVGRAIAEQDLRLNGHFAEIHKRFDRLERAMRLPGVEP